MGIWEPVVLQMQIPGTDTGEELELANLPSKGFSRDSQWVKNWLSKERNYIAES